MRGEGRDSTGRRGGGGGTGPGGRGHYDERWDPQIPEHDPGRDVSDMYEELQGPAGDEYIWPVHEEVEED